MLSLARSHNIKFLRSGSADTVEQVSCERLDKLRVDASDDLAERARIALEQRSLAFSPSLVLV